MVKTLLVLVCLLCIPQVGQSETLRGDSASFDTSAYASTWVTRDMIVYTHIHAYYNYEFSNNSNSYGMILRTKNDIYKEISEIKRKVAYRVSFVLVYFILFLIYLRETNLIKVWEPWKKKSCYKPEIL